MPRKQHSRPVTKILWIDRKTGKGRPIHTAVRMLYESDGSFLHMIIVKPAGVSRCEMWKIVGIVVFSIAFGMVLTVLISNRLASLIVAIILLLVSYNIIFCER